MNIKNLDLEEFLEHVQKIEETMSCRSIAEELPEEATMHTPAIGKLYVWMHKFLRSTDKKKPRHKRVWRKMERDFVVLLALRSMDNELLQSRCC